MVIAKTDTSVRFPILTDTGKKISMSLFRLRYRANQIYCYAEGVVITGKGCNGAFKLVALPAFWHSGQVIHHLFISLCT